MGCKNAAHLGTQLLVAKFCRHLDKGDPGFSKNLPFDGVAHEGIALVVTIPLVLHRKDRHPAPVHDDKVHPFAVDCTICESRMLRIR